MAPRQAGATAQFAAKHDGDFAAPARLLEEIKIAAHKRDVPCQSLIKMWLAEKVG